MTYPLKVSANRRYLEDEKGVPFLLQGDAAWSIIAELRKEEAESYLRNRAQKGFNAILVNLIEHWNCSNPPNNAYGEGPFNVPGDFSTPNEKYFEHADWVIRKAAESKILVLLEPMYLGSANFVSAIGGHEGWFEEVMSNNLERCLEYGRYLGKRYGDFDNILWLIGADRNPGQSLERLNMIALGIKEYDKRHLLTGDCAPEESPADEFSSGGWMDLNNAYSYEIVHRKLLDAYNRTPVMPFFLKESTYEGEHNASEVQIRRQAYWAVLCGGFGHVFGNFRIWSFGTQRANLLKFRVWGNVTTDWHKAMDTPGSIGMLHWGELFRSLPWFDLIPDQKHEVVTEGFGELRGLDYLSAACSADGSTVVAYMPTARAITVDLTKMSGKRVNTWWYDPRTGTATTAAEFPTDGSREFIPPGNGDWVLILGDASKNLPTPGKK